MTSTAEQVVAGVLEGIGCHCHNTRTRDCPGVGPDVVSIAVRALRARGMLTEPANGQTRMFESA